MKYVTPLYLLFLLLSTQTLSAKEISPQKARSAAITFLQQHRTDPLKSATPIQLTQVNGVLESGSPSEKQLRNSIAQDPELYLFLINGSEGFILVSGDDAAIPVPGYSFTESIDTTLSLPPNLRYWIQGYQEQIRQIREERIAPTEAIRKQWEGQYSTLRGAGNPVAPLLKTKWDQEPYFNDLCPPDAEYNTRAVVGCVATAMAQVMNYWEHPKQGTGVHGYLHPKYGLLKADFGTTRYQWEQMPDSLSGPNAAVATLMYHAGVAVNMDYATIEEGGSGAYLTMQSSTIDNPDALVALTAYFDYSPQTAGVYRTNYSDLEWSALMQAEMEAGRPVLYGAGGDGYGHAFVCDGYETNGYFHMNWGWSGIFNGYFQLGALNPIAEYPLNSRHQALVGLCPSDPSREARPLLSSEMVCLPSSLVYNKPFSLTTTVQNSGSESFLGDLGVGLFNDDFILVDIVAMKSEQTLRGGEELHLKFDSEAMGLMTPGHYRAYLLYRWQDEGWIVMSQPENAPSSYEFSEIEVTNPNELVLCSPIRPSSIPPLADSTLSVWLNVENLSENFFRGSLSLSVYSSKGEFIATVEEKKGLVLPPHSQFPDSLNFSNAHIPLEPGSYLLQVMYKRDGAGWELLGSSPEAPHPLAIRLQEPPPVADRYEINDSLESAWLLPVVYTSNKAVVHTPGSNFHNENDSDYYRITLEAGYEYRGRVIIHDRIYNTTDKEFVADACFTLSADGINWTEIIDDTPSDEFIIPGNTSVFIQAWPTSARYIGSYLLEIAITRQRTAPAEPEDPSRISVFPNPLVDYVTLSSPQLIETYSLYSPQGKLLKRSDGGQARILIDLSLYNHPYYILRFVTGGKSYTRKLLRR